MEIGIGQKISQERGKQKKTQQELADFLGVSKAAISKWETGKSYPDITLLPMIAAYFNVTIDELVNDNAQLSKEEIRHFYQSFSVALEQVSDPSVLEEIRQFTRRYYNCYPLVLQMGILLLNHLDQLPQSNDSNQRQRYLEEIKQLFVHVRQKATERELIDQSLKLEGYLLLLLQRPEEVLILLGEKVPTILPAETLIASAFQLKGEEKAADAIYQTALYQYICLLINLTTNYLQLLLNQPEKFKITVKQTEAIIDTYNFKKVHPLLVVSFLSASTVGFAQLGLGEAVYRQFHQLVTLMETSQSPTILHADTYFTNVDKWIDELILGNQTPREWPLIQTSLVQLFEQHPAFTNYQSSEEFQRYLGRLKRLKKRGEVDE